MARQSSSPMLGLRFQSPGLPLNECLRVIILRRKLCPVATGLVAVDVGQHSAREDHSTFGDEPSL